MLSFTYLEQMQKSYMPTSIDSIKAIMCSLYSGSCFKAIKAKYINTEINTHITRLLPNSACLIRNIEKKSILRLFQGLLDNVL